MSTAPKFFCFVLMPFDDSFEDTYELGIKASCIEAGTYCERVDEQIFQETILDRIYNQIAKADLVIADMSGRNPNVFYEVGYAHALNKPTILLTQNEDDIPFDLKHYPHIIYQNKISTLKKDLTKRIKWFQQNNGAVGTQYKSDLDIYVEKANLGIEKTTIEHYDLRLAGFDLVIHNSSTRTYQSGEFQIGIICEFYNRKGFRSDNIVTDLPDGKFLHMLPYFDQLFPESYTAMYVELNSFHDITTTRSENLIITIRVFTDFGIRDYPLELKYVPNKL